MRQIYPPFPSEKRVIPKAEHKLDMIADDIKNHRTAPIPKSSKFIRAKYKRVMPKYKALQQYAKDMIIKSATELFIKQGYEQTSVRQIHQKSGTVTGSFYQFFPSKKKLFEEIISIYMKNFSDTFLSVSMQKNKSFSELLQMLENLVINGLREYFKNLQGDKLHWTIQLSLHNRTLMSMIPGVEHLVEAGVKEGVVTNPLHYDIHTLAIATLYGVSSILYASDLMEESNLGMSHRKKDCQKYIAYMLGLSIAI